MASKFTRLSRKLAKRRSVRDPDAMARSIRKKRKKAVTGSGRDCAG